MAEMIRRLCILTGTSTIRAYMFHGARVQDKVQPLCGFRIKSPAHIAARISVCETTHIWSDAIGSADLHKGGSSRPQRRYMSDVIQPVAIHSVSKVPFAHVSHPHQELEYVHTLKTMRSRAHSSVRHTAYRATYTDPGIILPAIAH